VLAIIYSFLFSSIGNSEERGKESKEWEKLRSTTKEIWRINVQRYQISFIPSDKLYRLLRYRTPQETSDYLKWVTERSHLYAVGDRTPRVYPWMNEPGGGIIPPWNI